MFHIFNYVNVSTWIIAEIPMVPVQTCMVDEFAYRHARNHRRALWVHTAASQQLLSFEKTCVLKAGTAPVR